MIYIIGGNYQVALDYGKRYLGLHPGNTDKARFYSAMTVAQGPSLRGIQFHPGDRVYQVGMTFATGKELKQVEDVLDVCTMGLAVKVDTVPSQSGAHDVLVLTMLNVLEEIDPEMREIEELRRLLIEAQS